MRIKLPVLILAGVFISSHVAAEEGVPVLKSRSKIITIINGDHVKTDYWVLMPEKNPDVYHVEIPMKPSVVSGCGPSFDGGASAKTG